MEGRDESEEGEEGRGAHHCIIRLNRLEKNKYKVCQASFLPTPHRARQSVSPTTGRQAGQAIPRSVRRPFRRVGWLLVMTTHMAATVAVRPATRPRRALLPLCLSSRSAVLAGALFRHANYALWSCSRIEETRNEMHEEGRRRSGVVEWEERRVNISVEQKNERKRGRRREKTNAKPWRAV